MKLTSYQQYDMDQEQRDHESVSFHPILVKRRESFDDR